MGAEIRMPALSPTMEEGKLARWLVKEGDVVKSGDLLAEIETDKATMEFEAVDEGTIGKIVVPEGTEGVKVGTVIATIVEEGDSALPSAAASADPAQAVPPSPPAPAEPVVAQAGAAQAAAETPSDAITLREALRDAMAEEMRRDDRVFVM